MNAGERHWWQTRWFVVLAALIACVPLIWPDIPPIVDLPGHMGRYRVQLDRGAHAWLADWYKFEWSLIGNLGVDLLIEPLAPIIGLEPAVKLIVMAIPALTVAGLLWIAREVQGRIPATALFALPLAYGYPFQFGFVNFALSMGLALCLFALWLRMARLGRLRLRAIVFVPLSCLLWVVHTFGWGVLGVLAFSAEMIRQHDLRKDRQSGHWVASWFRAGLGCVPLALPMVLMVAWRSGADVTGQTADFFYWRTKIMWVLMALRDRWLWFDVASVAVIYLVLFKAVRDPRITYSRHLGLSALFMLVVFILLPRIVFGSAYADMRLAPFMLAIAVIAIRPKPGQSFRHASVLAAVGFAFFVVRIVAGTISFVQFDRDYDEELAALNHVPVGARLVSFVGHNCHNDWRMSRLEHLPAIALERRLAYTDDQWSMAGGQLMTVRYTQAGGYSHDPTQIVTPVRCRGEWWRPVNYAIARLPRDAFDYVWLIRPPKWDARFAPGLVPVWRSPTSASVLFRIDHSVPAPVASDEELGIPHYVVEFMRRRRERLIASGAIGR
ncbi:hypothetical protein HRV97_01340 [Sphingomonas sp. HHU CXW]|uniref:Glycosyltransferase RgtA/B/C/D-like domain-containing protein n=1 Tax=Sphingomonas hominis TaxID=2741495 RepID=A0ABX2JD37_9SPHN|nr:hypothetical protein [Sphingomonas hominis]NTS63803.1 hypothetical protein [Sphingomonas hominis]